MSIVIYTYHDPYKIDQEPYWNEIKNCPYFCSAQTLVNGLRSHYKGKFDGGRVSTVKILTDSLYVDWASPAWIVKQHTDIDNIINSGFLTDFSESERINISRAFLFNRDDVFASIRTMFECPIMVDKDLPSCGKSRFGCWVCTMVEKDKSMEAMIANDDEKEWMTQLLEFRNEFGNEDGDRDRRSFRRMHGNLQGNYRKLFHGPYKKEVREQWLRRLLEIQKNINETGPEEFQNLELIRIQELREIRKIWVLEKHEFDDAVPRIYFEVTGKEFEDPDWICAEGFAKEEWDILKKVCSDLYGDEELVFEMMYSLIDVESNAAGMNQRKGIIEELEKVIAKTFYKNEDDATQYYMEKVCRKKEYGGKYNEKFLDYGNQMPEEADEESEE